MTAPANPPDGTVDLHCAAGVEPGFDYRSPERLLAAMDACGIAYAALGPIGHWAAVAHEEGDRTLRAWCDRWPGRFTRWVTVNPWYPDARARLLASLTDGVAGLKLLPATQGFRLLQPGLVDPLLDVAEQTGKPVYVVSGVPVSSEPLQVAELARRRPGVTFVLGRSGRTDFVLDLLPALQAAPNLLAETAYNGAGLIRDLVHTVGADRLAFASDAPFNDLDLEMSRVGRARLDPDESCAVFTGTARRVFDGAGR